MPQSFIIKLYSETQVSGRLGMSGGISPRHAQNPLSGERRKTLSITHHALSGYWDSVFDNRSLMWDEWSYPEGVIYPIVK